MRGERRRTAIIAATLRLIARDGVSAVSHRAVAREAGVPASSVTYYFSSLDALLIATLTDSAQTYARQFRELVAEEPLSEGVAAAIAGAGSGSNRERVIAEYELTLLAARRPALRRVARRWMELVADIARRCTDDPVAVRAFVAAADGLCLQALLEEEPMTAHEAHAVLTHILGAGRPVGRP